MKSSDEKAVELARLERLGMGDKTLPQHLNLPKASVLIPLFFQENQLCMLLTQRPLHLNSHAGEVCFPGGKQDEEDKQDDVATALRETFEEVGISSSSITPVCRLATCESYHGLCVTPVVGFVEPSSVAEPSNLKINHDEVEAAFGVPISYFLEPHEQQQVEWKGSTFVMRTYYYSDNIHSQPFKIWGLTAHIAHQVSQIALGEYNTTSLPSEPRLKGKSGYLMRLEQGSGVSTKSYWARRFYVASQNMLHQYDSQRQASQKSQTATKKNRLPLGDATVELLPSCDSKFDFVVQALDGRIKWTLQASSEEERLEWKEVLDPTERQKEEDEVTDEAGSSAGWQTQLQARGYHG